ncbi:MAG: SAM-dependent methyltransferase, partial [Actinomycetota bacterium]
MPQSILPGDHKSIATYYDQTWFDYRALWLDPNNRAIHFGYWDESTKSHSESLLNMNRVLASNLRPEPGDLVLDAGCGVGGTSMWMAENRDVQAVGITITPS